MSAGMILFGVVTVLANWVTSYFYLLGGQLPATVQKTGPAEGAKSYARH